MPENSVYIGRGTKWGNPFRVVQYSFDKKWAVKTNTDPHCAEILTKHCMAAYDTKEEATKAAINCYGYWLLPYQHEGGSMMDFYMSMANMEDAIEKLKGKHLACWCKEGEACHGDLLLKMANE